MPFLAKNVEDVFGIYPELIVHPVNCQAVCKDSFSKQLKKTFPAYFREYTRLALRKQLYLGKPFVYRNDALFGTRIIMALPLREHWKHPVTPANLKQALAALAEFITEEYFTSVAMPHLEGPPLGWLEERLQNEFVNSIGAVHGYFAPVY